MFRNKVLALLIVAVGFNLSNVLLGNGGYVAEQGYQAVPRSDENPQAVRLAKLDTLTKQGDRILASQAKINENPFTTAKISFAVGLLSGFAGTYVGAVNERFVSAAALWVFASGCFIVSKFTSKHETNKLEQLKVQYADVLKAIEKA